MSPAKRRKSRRPTPDADAAARDRESRWLKAFEAKMNDFLAEVDRFAEEIADAIGLREGGGTKGSGRPRGKQNASGKRGARSTGNTKKRRKPPTP